MPFPNIELPADFELPLINPTPKKHPGNRANMTWAGRGRLKGTRNKVTRDLKNGVLEAAIELGSNGEGEGGLVGYLKYLGWNHPKAFSHLLGKLLPMQLTSDGSIGARHIETVNILSVPSGNYLSQEQIDAVQRGETVPAACAPMQLEQPGLLAPPSDPPPSEAEERILDNLKTVVDELARKAGVTRVI